MPTSSYQGLKLAVLSVVGLSRDAAHVYVGLAVFVGWLLLTGRLRPGWGAVVAVLLVAVGLEVPDLWDDWHGLGRLRWGASAHDVANTAFWPAVLAALGLRCRGCAGGPGGR